MDSDAPDTEQQPTLKQAAGRGVGWTALSRVVVEGTAFIAVVVVARTVTPEEFGAATLALLVGFFAVAVSVGGIGTALVQRETLSPGDAGTGAVLSVVLGLALAVVTFGVGAASGVLGMSSRLGDLIQLASLAFVLTALSSVPTALLQRELLFRPLAIIDSVAGLAGAATTIICALAGLEGESVILGLLVTLGITAAMSLVMAPFVRPTWRGDSARAIAAFATPAGLSSLLYIAVSKVDYVIVAARLGPTQMAFYARGFQLGTEYQGKVTNILVRMALPLYSRAASTAELRELRQRMTRLHATALFPFLLYLIPAAPMLVPAVFGDQWIPAVEPTQILVVAGLATTMAAGTNALVSALGHPHAMLRFTVAELAIIAAVVWLAAPEGIVAVSAAVAVARVVLLLILLRFVIQPIAGIPAWSSLADEAVPPLIAGVPLMAVVWGVVELGDQAGLPDLLTLAIAAAAGFLAYGVVVRLAFPAAWSDLQALGRRLRPGGSTA